jgi:signal transduction histidine kinase
MLLMVGALVSVGAVTRSLLLRQVEVATAAALEQEAMEFSHVAASGVDRATQEPFRDVRELLRNHLQRQYPSDHEVLVAGVRDSTGVQVLRQAREDEPYALHDRPDVLDPILGSPEPSGAAATEAGEMRWAKVTVADPGEPDTEGVFVVGYLVDRDRAAVSQTIRTLSLVSLVGLVVAAGASWLIAQQILAPVRLVRATASQITDQDLTRRIPVAGNDEFAALSEQFNAMLDRLEQALGTQRRFLDDASHELRTPITIIRGHLELLDVASEDPAERAAVIRLCTDELDRMSRIVEDLLLLAKAERPDFLRPAAVELAELTSDIDAKVRALGDRQWWMEAIGEGVVVVDQQRVTQAMAQLAHNAVQHTAPGDPIQFGSALCDGKVSFWITDSGPGVPKAEVEAIFERFHRGDSDPHGGRSGAGLGLAIVRAIADAHDGAVRVLSEPGHGATFGIELPARPARSS